MTAVNPSELEAGRWIKATLTAAQVVGPDALATDAYLDVVPSEADLPAVRFGVQARDDVRTNAQHIAVSKWDFLVVACVDTHEVALAASIAKEIDAALHRASGSTSDVVILTCTRKQTFGMTTVEDGKTYRLAGAVYEVIGQAA